MSDGTSPADPIVIRIRREHGPIYRYRIAGQPVAVDLSIAGLEGFLAAEGDALPWLGSESCSVEVESETIYDGQGWLGRQWRTVKCVLCDSGNLLLNVQGVGPLMITAQGQVVARGEPGLALTDPSLLAEVTMGPALILALALRGVYCLHASSILIDGHAAAFAGASGAGKSTMVGQWPPPFRRLTDDILPITRLEHQLCALPRYPQLKWPADSQPLLTRQQDHVPLASINLLDCGSDHAHGVRFTRLKEATAFRELLKHSVATQIFPPALKLRAHDFWASVASSIRIDQVTYVRQLQLLPSVRSEITRHLRSSDRLVPEV